MQRIVLAACASFLLFGCSPADQAASPAALMPAAEPLAPIRVSGSYWIELSPVLIAAQRFYPQQLTVGEGGLTTMNSGASDLATNAETQLLRESVAHPDYRIIMTVTESFYRVVARRSAGISTLADLKGKRVMLPPNTSAHYYLVAMLRTVGLTEDDVQIVPVPPNQGGQRGMDQMSEFLQREQATWPSPRNAARSSRSCAPSPTRPPR
jgi:sulfonate transport system substrate-binding protein